MTALTDKSSMGSFSSGGGDKIRNTEKKQIQPNTNEETNKSSTLQSVKYANDPHTTTSRQLAFQPLISKKAQVKLPHISTSTLTTFSLLFPSKVNTQKMAQKSPSQSKTAAKHTNTF